MSDTSIQLQVNGETVDLDVSDIDGVEWREVRKVSGFRPKELFDAATEMDFEAFAALLWVVRRRKDPTLEYDTVLKSLTLSSFQAGDDEAVDPPDVAGS